MANMASVAYAIEGPQKNLVEILGAICLSISDIDDHRYKEYLTCLRLGFPESQLRNYRLGGEIAGEPTFDKINGVLKFWAEERWGLQDFNELLEKKFPDIKVYWQVEERGCEIYCTNDKEGKYFPEKYWVDTAHDDIYDSEYFNDEESMWKWLDEKYGVKSQDEVDAWNQDYEATGDECENFIYIHEFEIEE